MAKIDLDSLSIEELASLRDHATDKLFEKVAARRAELEAELEKLAQYGKPVKKVGRRAGRQGQEERRGAGAEGAGRQGGLAAPIPQSDRPCYSWRSQKIGSSK